MGGGSWMAGGWWVVCESLSKRVVSVKEWWHMGGWCVGLFEHTLKLKDRAAIGNPV